jgi:hypothetical protein
MMHLNFAVVAINKVNALSLDLGEVQAKGLVAFVLDDGHPFPCAGKMLVFHWWLQLKARTAMRQPR